ncbi:MAG: hypothetical protein NVS9B9_12920 [Ktedonobacteraceae bacterium]
MAAASSSWNASSTICKLTRTDRITDQRSPLAASVTAPFIEFGEEGPHISLRQSQEVILSWFADQFLIKSDGNHLTVRKMERWTWPLQNLLDHG